MTRRARDVSYRTSTPLTRIMSVATFGAATCAPARPSRARAISRPPPGEDASIRSQTDTFDVDLSLPAPSRRDEPRKGRAIFAERGNSVKSTIYGGDDDYVPAEMTATGRKHLGASPRPPNLVVRSSSSRCRGRAPVDRIASLRVDRRKSPPRPTRRCDPQPRRRATPRSRWARTRFPRRRDRTARPTARTASSTWAQRK